MTTASKSLAVLGVTLLALGQIAQGCTELSSFLVSYDFKSSACKKAIFNGEVTSSSTCDSCALDLPTIIASLNAATTETCKSIASTLAYTCSYDDSNDNYCPDIIDVPIYTNCTDGFFSCCLDIYGDYVSAQLGTDATEQYSYSYLCNTLNPTQVIPTIPDCTVIDTTGVTPVTLTALPTDSEFELDCPELLGIVAAASVGSSCIPLGDTEPDYSVVCSAECAAEVAAVYDEIAAVSDACGYYALQLQTFCTYDTTADLYCAETDSLYGNDTCAFAKSCCGVSQVALVNSFADTIDEPTKTYLKYVSLSLDADLVCPDGTIAAAASTCEAPAFSTLIGKTDEPRTDAPSAAAQVSLWVAMIIATILSIYFTM